MKKFIPKLILKLYGRIKRRVYRTYYFIKFRPLIIRKGTSDWKAFKQIFISRDYDFPVNIEPKLIIDGGANVGYASLFFADKFPDAQIFAIEPEESNFAILKKNTARFNQIIPIQAGLWHKNSFLKVMGTGQGEWGFITAESDPGDHDVKTITISDILQLAKSNEIDILKLDIEGAEKELFSENYESWLGKVNVLIIELHDRLKAGCSDAFFSAIKKYNFEQIKRGENIILFKLKI